MIVHRWGAWHLWPPTNGFMISDHFQPGCKVSFEIEAPSNFIGESTVAQFPSFSVGGRLDDLRVNFSEAPSNAKVLAIY